MNWKEFLNMIVLLPIFPIFGICNTTVSVRIEKKIEDVTTLEETLKQMGIPYVKANGSIKFGNGVIVSISGGVMRYESRDENLANSVRQEYGANVAVKTAKKKGYTVTKKKVNGKIYVQARRF